MMSSEQLHLVANEMSDMGFSTHIKDDSVIIGLKRFLSVNEVSIALAQVFEGIEFEFSRIDFEKVRVS